MADPQLEKFLKEAAAQKAATQAPAAVKPVVAPVAVQPSVPVKVAKAEEERTAPILEAGTPSAEDVKTAEKMRADLLEELPLEDFYSEAARFPLASTAVRAYERKSKIPKERFTSLAGVQGIDVEDMAKKAREGVPFAEYRRTHDSVIGFKTATERLVALDRVAKGNHMVERGAIPQHILRVQMARETMTANPGSGEGDEVVGTTPDAGIETLTHEDHRFMRPIAETVGEWICPALGLGLCVLVWFANRDAIRTSDKPMSGLVLAILLLLSWGMVVGLVRCANSGSGSAGGGVFGGGGQDDFREAPPASRWE